jgi:cell division protein FtsB
MDDIRPPRNKGPVQAQSSYGKSPGWQQSNQHAVETPVSEQPTTVPEYHQDTSFALPESKKSGKGTKVVIFFLILLTLAASAFAAYEYMQVTELQSQVDELNKENDRLNERVYSLNYDNRDLTQKLQLVTDENEALKEENAKLQEACGAACDNITP